MNGFSVIAKPVFSFTANAVIAQEVIVSGMSFVIVAVVALSLLRKTIGRKEISSMKAREKSNLNLSSEKSLVVSQRSNISQQFSSFLDEYEIMNSHCRLYFRNRNFEKKTLSGKTTYFSRCSNNHTSLKSCRILTGSVAKSSSLLDGKIKKEPRNLLSTSSRELLLTKKKAYTYPSAFTPHSICILHTGLGSDSLRSLAPYNSRLKPIRFASPANGDTALIFNSISPTTVGRIIKDALSPLFGVSQRSNISQQFSSFLDEYEIMNSHCRLYIGEVTMTITLCYNNRNHPCNGAVFYTGRVGCCGTWGLNEIEPYVDVPGNTDHLEFSGEWPISGEYVRRSIMAHSSNGTASPFHPGLSLIIHPFEAAVKCVAYHYSGKWALVITTKPDFCPGFGLFAASLMAIFKSRSNLIGRRFSSKIKRRYCTKSPGLYNALSDGPIMPTLKVAGRSASCNVTLTEYLRFECTVPGATIDNQ
uniref:Uncharacterized protein n=1 Tax=Glossina brevipalpis TaxID=37001 RepID=A0A1A9W1T2_9MUSC